MNSSRYSRSARTLLKRSALFTVRCADALFAAPLAAGADTAVPSVDAVSVSGADITVNWTLNVADATSLDVILYDASGNVVQDDTLDPSATSDTFYSVAAATGYYVEVSATDTAGTTASLPSSTVDVLEGPAVITSVGGSGAAVTVTWTNTSPDATGIDVILYDANGNVVTDDTLDPSTTSDTFANVPDGQGYYVVVTTHTPSGDFDSNSSDVFTLAGGTFSTDTAVSFNDLSCVDGTVSVSWSSNSPDATSYDVILLDANGNVISQVTVDPSVTSYDFTAVADATNYSVEVVAHTPIGDLNATSWNFSVANGQLVQIPVDPPIVFGGGSGEVVDPSTVVLTPVDGGGWSVSWNEVADAAGTGYYLVSDDQGDTCVVDSTGVAGANVSCTLAALSDPTASLSGLSVTYFSDAFRVDNFGSVTPTALSEGVVAFDKAPVPTTKSAPATSHHVAVAAPVLAPAGDSVILDWLVGFGGLLLASAVALTWRSRARRHGAQALSGRQ